MSAVSQANRVIRQRLKNRRLPTMEVPQVDSSALAQALQSIQEHFRMYEGESGAPKERFVTMDELERAGLIKADVKSGFAYISQVVGKDVAQQAGSTAKPTLKDPVKKDTSRGSRIPGGGGGGGGATASKTAAVGSQQKLAQAEDVGVSKPAQSEFLFYDGGKWTNFPLFSRPNRWRKQQRFDMPMQLISRPEGPSGLADFGYIWAKNDDPTTLWFTDSDGTEWQMATSAAVPTELSDLSDVNTSTPTNRNVLVADGVDWESRALVEADISDFGSYEPADGTILKDADIGSTVQAYDADLDTWATVTPSANGQSLVSAANYAAMRTLLDLEAGTDFYSIAAADAAFAAAAHTHTFDSLTSKTSGTGNYTTTGDFIADNFEATGTGPNSDPGVDDAYIGGYGFLGDRTGTIYFTNFATNGTVSIGTDGAHNANVRAIFSDYDVSDYGTSGRIQDGIGTMRPIGFNTIPVYEIDAADTFDLAHNGMLWHKDSAGAITYTCASDTTIPQGATYLVVNDDTEDVTISAGAITLYWFEGGAAPTSGNVTVEQGGVVTVYKYSDTEFWAWGSKEAGGGGGGISNVVEDTTPQLGGDLDLQTFAIVTSSAGTTGEFVETATAGSFRISNGTQWADIGPRNSSYCHFDTNASSGFYFYDNVTVLTDLKVLGGSFYMTETTAAAADVAAQGQFWVKNNVPNDPYFTNDIGVDYPIGFATYRRSAATTLDNINQTLNMTTDSVADAMVGGAWVKTSTTARTLTLEPSTDTEFPVGAQIAIWNRAASGTMTVTEGSGTTLYVLDGSSSTDAAGSATIAAGGYATLIRESTTVYVLMGAGVTP